MNVLIRPEGIMTVSRMANLKMVVYKSRKNWSEKNPALPDLFDVTKIFILVPLARVSGSLLPFFLRLAASILFL